MTDLRCYEDSNEIFGISERSYRSRKAKKQPRKHISKGYRYWAEDEHIRFLKAFLRYGSQRQYTAQIAQQIGTRTPKQVASHLQKFLIRVEKADPLERQEMLTIESSSSEENVIDLGDYIEQNQPTIAYWDDDRILSMSSSPVKTKEISSTWIDE